eukprot:UN17119
MHHCSSPLPDRPSLYILPTPLYHTRSLQIHPHSLILLFVYTHPLALGHNPYSYPFVKITYKGSFSYARCALNAYCNCYFLRTTRW